MDALTRGKVYVVCTASLRQYVCVENLISTTLVYQALIVLVAYPVITIKFIVTFDPTVKYDSGWVCKKLLFRLVRTITRHNTAVQSSQLMEGVMMIHDERTYSVRDEDRIKLQMYDMGRNGVRVPSPVCPPLAQRSYDIRAHRSSWFHSLQIQGYCSRRDQPRLPLRTTVGLRSAAWPSTYKTNEIEILLIWRWRGEGLRGYRFLPARPDRRAVSKASDMGSP